MPRVAFAAAAVPSLQRSTFAGACVPLPLCRTRSGLAFHRERGVTVAVLGLPRSGRDAKTVEGAPEAVVSVPPSPPSKLVASYDWARAHPIRSSLLLALGISAFQQLVSGRKKKSAPSVPSPTPKAGVASSPQGNRGSGFVQATPKRHETTEEAMDLLGNTARKYIIIGGKGGVGKTSSSCATATKFADRGQVTLIVSTDPAHSLSDAFDQPLSGGEPVPVIGIDNLYAQEINPETMKNSFRLLSETGGANDLAGLGDMGLDDLNSLFETLPPGFDEAVALVEIVKLLEGDPAYRKYERIVFDTAPTGHTLRLLSLPQFLDGFFGKIISMKSKFGNVMNQFKGMFGGNNMDQDLDASMNDIEELKRSMAVVRDLFRDEIQTEFIVTTIPNMMAIAESKRLVDELKSEQIPVRHVFVNQVQPSNPDCSFCSARHKEHTSNMKYIENQFEGLRIATVQSFDREIRGAYALRAMGSQLFPNEAALPPSDVVDSATTKPVQQATPTSPTAVKAEIVE